MQPLLKSILIFGPPGSGKGTVGKSLSKCTGHFHLSSGDIFRGLSPESPSGKVYNEYASKGLLLPDDITVKIWHKYVTGLIATNRYFPEKQYLLLDGIPRTKGQVKLLQDIIKVDAVIVLEVKEESILIERMQKRALIEKRTIDADLEVLKTRFAVYHRETKEILKLYPEKALHTIRADQKPLEVLKDILNKLTYLLAN